MTPTVKAASPAQFLSFVPHLLGFHPQQSLVIVPFERGRSVGAMRFDLPSPERSDGPDAVASAALGLVCRLPNADAFTAVVYCDEPFAGIEPHRDLAEALKTRADACGLTVTDALCVAADAWGSLLDTDATGLGLDVLGAAGADFGSLESDQGRGADLPATTSAQRADAKRALHQVRKALAAMTGAPAVRGRIDPLALAATVRLDDLPTLYEEMLAWDAASLTPYEAALAVYCLTRPAVRDIGLVQWTAGPEAGEAALDAQLRWEAGADYPAELGRIMWGEADILDPGRLRTALEIARAAAAVAPRRDQPGALATAAWLSWALGRSTHAERYAARACAIAPEHGLSEIVLSFVSAGHLPDWAFRRGAAARG